jgi:CHAP domain
MSIQAALERVSAIRQALADPALLIGSNGALTGGAEGPTAPGGASGQSSFASALARASASSETPAIGAAVLEGSGSTTPGLTTPALSDASDSGLSALQGVDGVSGSIAPASTGPGAQIVAVAESQLGQAEQPPGSNEGAAIAQYRTATAGAAPGEPWCAYFASWVAREAGEPIGAGGQGAGSVSGVWSWAQSAGRAVVNGPGVVPKPGDLIVFGGEHVGIVRGVLSNGQIATIEGNYENKVAANVRSPTEATGYVSMS